MEIELIQKKKKNTESGFLLKLDHKKKNSKRKIETFRLTYGTSRKYKSHKGGQN